MASPNATFTEIVSTTLRNHPSEISDNVSNHNALYRYLQRRGKIEKISGGYEIARTLDYAENSSFQRYSGYDTLNVQASDVLSAASYSWVQSAIHVTASGRELRMNNGREAMIKLVQGRINNAKRTAANYMSLDLYSSGALSNQMTGLAGSIGTDGTGTVGGIDAGTYTFWANQYKEAAGTNAVTSSTIRGEMNTLWLTCVRGTDKPDLIVSTHDFYAAYEASLQDLQRFASNDEAAAGFNSLKYKTADVIFDSNTNFATTGERMYFLNTNYIDLVVHSQANWNMVDEKVSVNQDAVVIPMIWQGQLCLTNRSLQGILIDAA